MKNAGKHIPPPIITDAFRSTTSNSDAILPESHPQPLTKQNQALPTPPQSPQPPPKSPSLTTKKQPPVTDQQHLEAFQPSVAKSPQNDSVGTNPIDESNYAVTEL